MQVAENEIRLAIDMAVQEMYPGEQARIENLDAQTQAGLVHLINLNPKLRAISDGGVIVLRRGK